MSTILYAYKIDVHRDFSNVLGISYASASPPRIEPHIPVSLHLDTASPSYHACSRTPSLKDFQHHKGESRLQRLGCTMWWNTQKFLSFVLLRKMLPLIHWENRCLVYSSHPSNCFKTRINRFNHKENQRLTYNGILTQPQHQHPSPILTSLSAHDRLANHFYTVFFSWIIAE